VTRAGPHVTGPTSRGVSVGGVSLRFGTHLSALYADDVGRIRTAAAFLVDGLKARSVCFLVAEPPVSALSPSLLANRALLDYFAGRYDVAESRLRELLRSDSTDVTVKWGLALVDEQQGRFDEAIAILEPISAVSNNRKASLGHAYALAGKTAKARTVLSALHAAADRNYVPFYWFALVHAGLGERDQARRYLERAYEERSTVLATS
jgi:tetratricopeptide (TPR) repeat protein